jgi:hypothetical protein
MQVDDDDVPTLTALSRAADQKKYAYASLGASHSRRTSDSRLYRVTQEISGLSDHRAFSFPFFSFSYDSAGVRINMMIFTAERHFRHNADLVFGLNRRKLLP